MLDYNRAAILCVLHKITRISIFLYVLVLVFSIRKCLNLIFFCNNLWLKNSMCPSIYISKNSLIQCWMVPDDTLHKGTSKHHKMDEKGTRFAVHISSSIFGFWNYPTTPITHSKIQWDVLFYLITHVYGETCTTVLSVFFFVSNPKKYVYLCRSLIFASSWYTSE